jgi:hypothetical protein
MGQACFGCAVCGHAWRAESPRGPRLLRGIGLASPMVVGGAIGMGWNPSAGIVVVVGVAIGVLGYHLCTPACPSCGSERTLRTRFSIKRDARVIEGESSREPAPRRVRVG